MRFSYHYAEVIGGEVHQHAITSDNKSELLIEVKKHWDSENKTPLNLFRGPICIIDKEGFVDLKNARDALKDLLQ